jgi:hypothetical protein
MELLNFSISREHVDIDKGHISHGYYCPFLKVLGYVIP